MSTGLIVIACLFTGFVAGLVTYAAIDGQQRRDARFREERERQAEQEDISFWRAS